MCKTRLVLMIVLVAFVMSPLQAVQLDSMDNIAARPWVDERDTQDQARPGWMSQGVGVMKIDYGVTNDSAGIPDPCSGWDYLGNWIGVGGAGAAFTSAAGNVGGFNADNYAGDFDRVPAGPFTFAELGILTTSQVFTLDVFKTVANSPEHVRELQLYDSSGFRNTYQVQAEATASSVGAGWKKYVVPLSSPMENNADLTDIAEIKLWVSAWSAFVSGPGDPPAWPDDYTVVPRTGTPVLIDNLQLFSPVSVRIDIKPQSCPNPLNKKSNGVLPVAVLGCTNLDVHDIDVASVRLAGVPAIRSGYADVASPVSAELDSMDNIAARPWVDERDTQDQARPGWMSQGAGVMKIDYGVTNDSAGVPDPASGWDYLGNWIGVGGAGAAFTSAAGNVGGFNADNYAGDFDRVPAAPFSFAELGILTTGDVFPLDVFKTIANSPEHVRELQLYDSSGFRNTYQVQAEATASSVGAGWKTYCVPLSAPMENNADLSDIVEIKLWVSAWSAFVSGPGDPPAWPDDYTVVPRTGTPVLIDNLRLARADGEDCECTTEAGDGITDLTLKFNKLAIVQALGEVTHGDVVPLTLTARMLGGQPIEGVDCVVIRGKGERHQRRQRKRR